MTEIPPPSFLAVVQLHQIQSMFHLGLLPDPRTGEPGEVNLEMARYEFELLKILQDKTAGNLDNEEMELLDDVISSLQYAIEQRGGEGTGG